MNKIYMKADIVEDIIDTKKGILDSNMILRLVNGKKYKLVVAVKLLDKYKASDNLSKLIFSIDELEMRNYELYSALSFTEGRPLLRKNDLFDDEIEADGQIYKVDIGYTGTLLSKEDYLNKDYNTTKAIDFIGLLKQEHIEIKKQVYSLGKEMNHYELNFKAINSKLNLLFDYVTDHTEREALFLYPNKFNSINLQKINKENKENMKKIYDDFLSYYNMWENKVCEENFDTFKTETKKVLKLLVSRIVIEENEILKNF